VRSQAAQLDVDVNQFEQTDVHVHVPAGAIPKDGPSAGLALVTSIASLFTGRQVRSDVGMTGEVTLRGRVLAVGGIKMKVLAGHRAGLTTIILPKRNEPDLEELPDDVRNTMTFVAVEHIDDVLKVALLPVETEIEAPETIVNKGFRQSKAA
jgi:ATP-dependent Lon protease